MSWNDMQKAKAESGSNLYVKLKDGQAIEGVFRGEPRIFYQIYGDKTKYAEWREGRSFKFEINLVVKDPVTQQMTAKIFSQGAVARDALIDAKNEYGLDCVYKIKRVGSGPKDTRYSILFKKNLSEEELASINGVKLVQLTNIGCENADGLNDNSPDDLPPFDDDVHF